MFHERFHLGMLLIAVATLLPAQNRKQPLPKFTAPDNVEVSSDIVYAKDGDRQIRLDLYLPKPRPAQAIPGVVVIRGGGWRVGDKEGFAFN
jgi:acetyl esterase/lipase